MKFIALFVLSLTQRQGAVIVKIKMNLKEKFELLESVTILACSGYDPKFDVIGKRLNLVRGDEIRQTLTISDEKKMFNQKAFETNNKVLLSQEEAQSSEWQLISI